MAVMAGVVWVRGRLGNRLVMDGAILGVLVLLVISLSVAAHARNLVWQDEVKLWEDVIKRSPTNARAQYNRHESLGRAYLSQNRFTDALQEFQSALKIKADFADPHKNLGYAYMKLRDFSKALEEYQTAIKYEPNSFESHYNLGNVYLNIARNEEAMKEYQLASKLDPSHADACRKLEYLRRVTGTIKKDNG
jgi:tetratricopeptide (TPR) repeat protein